MSILLMRRMDELVQPERQHEQGTPRMLVSGNNTHFGKHGIGGMVAEEVQPSSMANSSRGRSEAFEESECSSRIVSYLLCGQGSRHPDRSTCSDG